VACSIADGGNDLYALIHSPVILEKMEGRETARNARRTRPLGPQA
jgi:hypothetical protein